MISTKSSILLSTLKTKKVILIEDAAEALGSRIKSKYLGTIGDIGTFSFHETKKTTCYNKFLIPYSLIVTTLLIADILIYH